MVDVRIFQTAQMALLGHVEQVVPGEINGEQYLFLDHHLTPEPEIQSGIARSIRFRIKSCKCIVLGESVVQFQFYVIVPYGPTLVPELCLYRIHKTGRRNEG